MPNLSQLRQASKSLPDPETWPEDSYEYALEVDDARQTIAFKRLKLKRSSGTSFRWIYEGKVLFRNRDIGTKE